MRDQKAHGPDVTKVAGKKVDKPAKA
jgi:hypothetical protein